jgi:NADH dehydrogenase
VSRLFVTGGSGFVGSRLVPALRGRGHTVTLLDRTGALGRGLADDPGLHVVAGDLVDPSTYRDALGSAEVVIHLAAVTGRASRAVHFRANALGTETLVDACTHAGVRRLLFMSSIAVDFPDRRGYHYAEAKVRAEGAVRRSGLAFAILRPTMIFGPGSPVLSGLETLALLPVIPIFGDGRTLVQPIDVNDVVRSVIHVIERDWFTNETFAIGGREVLTIEALLQRIRTARRGVAGRTLRVPIGLLRGPLRAAESFGLGRVLPVTAGQLSSFRFPGTVSANPLQQALEHECRTVSEMLAPAPPLSPSGRQLDQECRVFTAYLLGTEPSDYVRRKYADGHQLLTGLSPTDRFEGLLVGAARAHCVLARMADAYARVVMPGSVSWCCCWLSSRHRRPLRPWWIVRCPARRCGSSDGWSSAAWAPSRVSPPARSCSRRPGCSSPAAADDAARRRRRIGCEWCALRIVAAAQGSGRHDAGRGPRGQPSSRAHRDAHRAQRDARRSRRLLPRHPLRGRASAG